jgi:hypothetical protein
MVLQAKYVSENKDFSISVVFDRFLVVVFSDYSILLKSENTTTKNLSKTTEMLKSLFSETYLACNTINTNIYMFRRQHSLIDKKNDS